ncbi:dihydrofolate reductase family protein [Roseisolibacter sp. H3M3-2]|uniref:dihydrofolate reductase family protein n=1 Tax=Roseisolibacter sp. H3M3-2 TaxID=3031323 RepID=UPI0023DCD060|nr:dihydrofolate reductase family protein [Roseisolibacter sp. H3M3-2]MDF1502244.1 dihydrofolate reductase family protein [Roseisolibacter sp. H3M3-2]
MPLRASAFIATSLDGFIARPDGALDWLPGADPDAPPEDDHGYAAFLADVDVIVWGRATYDVVAGFDMPWPYGDRRVVVLSTTLKEADLPERFRGKVEVHPGPVAALVARLEAAGARHAYVDGGQVIRGFLREGRLDALTVTRVPVLLGVGIPLFGDVGGDVRMTHVRTVAYESGLVQSTYAARAEAPRRPTPAE